MTTIQVQSVVSICLLLATVALECWTAGIPAQNYKFQAAQSLGLYNSSDKVTILTSSNFKDAVQRKNSSTLVEFYNSYCGHCKRFAPLYKELAADILPWYDVVHVAAIDCAAEENNDICREYEIMAYPTLRYFEPNYEVGVGNYGRQSINEVTDIRKIRSTLAKMLAAENRTTYTSGWPNFEYLNNGDLGQALKNGNSHLEFAVVVYEPANSTVGIETILYLLRYPSVLVRRVNNLQVAQLYQLDGEHYKMASIDRQGDLQKYAPVRDVAKDYATMIKSVLEIHKLTERPFTSQPWNVNQTNDENDERENAKIIDVVKSNKHLVYQADLEMAVYHILYNEIPKVANIDGERLLALQRFLAVLNRYNMLGTNGRVLVNSLYEYVIHFNQEISGKDFESTLRRLAGNTQIFSADRYIGCAPSYGVLRGFTCSVWQLFHFLTVQAATNNLSQDPLEVLQAMHGVVKYFFGCTDCSEHFQEMASRRKIWNVPNKDEAVLWLWAAHNEVNKRLAGDSTEDPEFPKIQFPSQSSCRLCYKEPARLPDSLEINWDKDAVLGFLKNIHNREYVSLFGLSKKDLLGPTVEKLRQKRMITNVFTDIDMRMGMLLYGFCIIMLVVAFKLFAYKGGYRKKAYGGDFLGKV